MKLDNFSAIAWDFDGTLIDHPNAPWMHRYILDHPEKKHFIITFRTHGMQYDIFREMKSLYPEAPERNHFADIFNIGERAWTSFAIDQVMRQRGKLTGDMTLSEEYYVNWKGLVCRLRDIPVLIDDVYQLEHGCKKNGIKYIHPDWLLTNIRQGE